MYHPAVVAYLISVGLTLYHPMTSVRDRILVYSLVLYIIPPEAFGEAQVDSKFFGILAAFAAISSAVGYLVGVQDMFVVSSAVACICLVIALLLRLGKWVASVADDVIAADATPACAPSEELA